MRKRAGVVIYNYKNGEILLIKRQKNGKVYYTIPGGGVEAGESICEAAKRELFEELNYKAKCEFFFFRDEEEYYYLDFVDKSPAFTIHGEEKSRQKSTNIYQPVWIKTKYITDSDIYPRGILQNLYKIRPIPN